MTQRRQEQKERTRQAILAAALRLAAEDGLATVSLRQVAKEVGIVPTAFYRHFASVEDLGLALVDDSFASLRAMLRDVRTGAPEFADLIDSSLSVLLNHIKERREHFGFIARERVAGPSRVREAIAREICLITRELTTDLAQLAATDAWSTEDLELLADLIVSFVVSTIEDLLLERSEETEVVTRTRRQLRMLLIGALNWHSSGPA